VSRPPQQGPETAQDRSRHLLSFDVEEYFQVEAAAEGGMKPDDWPGQPRRLRPAVERILEILAECGASATFFVLGWVSNDQPELIRQIAAAGHEIASHGMDHAMLNRLAPADFSRQLRESRRLLEDIAGKPVIGYRAPTFSLTHRTAWALDALAESGFEYDSSVYPVRHDRYGVPDAPPEPHRASGPAGGTILELPPLTFRVLGWNWPIGGGGYLRLFPVKLLAMGLEAAAAKGLPGMIYLHPWEVDPHQPILPMRRLSRWRHRVNLRRTENKLHRLARRFCFTSVAARLGELKGLAQRTFRYEQA